VFDVEITVPNVDGALKVGMVAAVQVGDASASSAQPALVAPLSAIVRGKGDGYAIYVVEDQAGEAVARLRSVTLGPMIGNQIAVTAGLRPGERVVVSGATIVTDGERVSIMP
jgi:multidrug efflux system membrane fusion protein